MAIEQISDTALWIAAYRAAESERPDAVFNDPLARRLAGERGREMAEGLPNAAAMAFAMVVRTTAIDRLIEDALARGVDTVVNLAAGLDTRPYRMALPAELRWIEVDFPHLLAYKAEQLAGEVPRCRLERIGADLTDPALYERFSGNALVITEGLLGYLTNEQAGTLARRLAQVPAFKYWIYDFAQGRMRRTGGKNFKKVLEKSPLQLKLPDPLAFFAGCGWKRDREIMILDEADRIGRAMPAFWPWSLLIKLPPVRALGNHTFGYALMAK